MIIPEHNYTLRERTVCEILRRLPGARSMLNVGMRNPSDPRNHWWLKICQANGVEPHVLEVFPPNCKALRQAGIENVTCGDVRQATEIYARTFDIVLWWHGPEHLDKHEALEAIRALEKLAEKVLILGCPLGKEPQEVCYGNLHERHLSGWSPQEFEGLGLHAEVVCDDRPFAHITAWKETAASSAAEVAGDAARCELSEAAASQKTPLKKIALVFDDQTRPETTGVYCRRALESMVELEFFAPADLARIPRSEFDLYLAVDDGLRYPWPDDLRPSAWWCIDTHIDFEWSLSRSTQFDFVFAAQREGAALLRQGGITSARWLPLACDPEIHGKQQLPKRWDVCFVGNLLPGPRVELVRLLEQHFKNAYVGQAYFEEMARIYSESRVVFNRSVKDDLNMRVFEALASGSLLLTNDLPQSGQAEFFRDGVHLAVYRDAEELLDKLRYYLRNESERERIAAAGREAALARHTYRHRMQTLLDWVAEDVSRSSSHAPGVGGERNPTACALAPARDGDCIESEGRVEPEALPAPADRQDLWYFEFARPELLARVPEAARRVLEIGCGTGRLGEALKRRQSCEVVGIELDERAAALAATRLDQVLCGDVERMELKFPAGSFDAIVCGDVLEHLYDPGKFLAQSRIWLKPDGVLVASIPNVRHKSVVASLLAGNWTYEPAGLLDATHLRFFTRRRIEQLFKQSGYRMLRTTAVPRPGDEPWREQNSSGEVQLGSATIRNLARAEAEEFFVYQYLIVASPAVCAPLDREGEGKQPAAHDPTAASEPPQASEPADADPPRAASQAAASPAAVGEMPAVLPKCLLLIVTYNRLEYTRLALEAVLKLDYPHLEVVVWDNASTDGTVEYLRERLAGASHARLIASEENRGVVYPMNAVWRSDPEAQLLAKVDNDTLVPPDLLRRLALCHLRSDRFGALSGFHFRQEGEALAEESRIKTFDGVRILPQPYVGGCAIMVRKQTLEALGPIPCAPAAQDRPFMDSGWTIYQQRLTDLGLINGYPWPPIHVDHMEDTRSPHCIRSAAHQQYKREERGMGLEQFTEELCVWRPNWAPGSNGDGRNSQHREGAVLRAGGPAAVLAQDPNSLARMRFDHDFVRDFEQFDFRGAPFAFARFADGERAICMGAPIRGQDGWSYDGHNARFREALSAALRYDAPGYYLGISDGCCDAAAKEWYLGQIAAPLERVTFSNIFVNANYRRFLQLDLGDMAIVASEGGDYWVPEDVMSSDFDLDKLVERLLAVDRPILVSAGPASCIIIHKYWQRAERKQTIVDVGSAIDERLKGRKTRQYQIPGTRTAELSCTW